ncbi:TetR/AcrR family transcriptional regulator [Alsobacter sp. R-9]
MPRDRNQTRRTILDRSYELFYRQGINRVGVDEIAAGAGVTKRTLYNHFPSKDDLLAAALEHQHILALDRFTRWGDRLAGTPGDIVEQIFAALAQWATRPRWAGAGFTRVAMELADLKGHPARSVAQRHKASLEAWLAGRLARENVAAPTDRAREIVVLLEGATALIVIHGETDYALAAGKAARRLVEG